MSSIDSSNPPLIDPPRSPYRRSRGGTNTGLYAWMFLRVSGVLLIVLVLGHLFILNILDGGVQRINWAFAAARWASPFWQVWDLLMLWLALLHGTNGMRTIIDDYTRRDATRLWLKALLYVAASVVIALGTLVLFTFDPTL